MQMPALRTGPLLSHLEASKGSMLQQLLQQAMHAGQALHIWDAAGSRGTCCHQQLLKQHLQTLQHV